MSTDCPGLIITPSIAVDDITIGASFWVLNQQTIIRFGSLANDMDVQIAPDPLVASSSRVTITTATAVLTTLPFPNLSLGQHVMIFRGYKSSGVLELEIDGAVLPLDITGDWQHPSSIFYLDDIQADCTGA